MAPVEALRFPSADGTEIEAFLTRPLGQTATSRHPLIVMIHGGPHGQQGPAFTPKAQVYAAQGWAALMVNYRGSTGYGQALADKIFGDQNGGEAADVLAGVDAALARYPWIDPARLGIEGTSYGGQLTNWIITQTDRFKAAVPNAGISNLVSFNYMAYYHDYLAVEFGRYPHENGLMETLWERSPIRLIAQGEDADAHHARRERQRRPDRRGRTALRGAARRRRADGAGPLPARGPRPARDRARGRSARAKHRLVPQVLRRNKRLSSRGRVTHRSAFPRRARSSPGPEPEPIE